MSLIQQSGTGTVISPSSSDATPAPEYIGWWPMTQWTGAVGALTYPSLTLANTTVDTTNNWVDGVAAATWLTAGVPFKYRPAGTTIGSVSSTVVYYAGKPTADRVTFHLTAAAAIAGTSIVDFTGAPSGNITLYPAHIKDWSGQGNDMIFGAATTDQQAWASAPRMGCASSASVDNCLGRLNIDTLTARYTWATDTLFASFRVLFGTLTAGRSFWGHGSGSPAADGPRLSVDSTDTSKCRMLFYHGGAGSSITVGTSSAEACSTSAEHTIGILIDGPAKTLTMYIDGVQDLTINSVSLAAASSVTLTQDLRIGGAQNTNSQIANFADYHLLRWSGSAPSNIDALALRLASTRYQRLRDVDA